MISISPLCHPIVSPTYVSILVFLSVVLIFDCGQLIKHVKDRIGEPAISVDPDRIVAILESRKPDNTGPNAPEVRLTALCYSPDS